ELKLSLRSVEAEMARRAEDLKPAHPYMVRLAESREEIQRQIREQLAIIDEMRKARIESLRQEALVLDQQIEAKRAEVAALRETHRQFVALAEDLSSKKAWLNQLSRELQALTQIPVSDEDFTILEEGVASDKPVGPKRYRIIVAGVALGLLSGIGLIFLLHR